MAHIVRQYRTVVGCDTFLVVVTTQDNEFVSWLFRADGCGDMRPLVTNGWAIEFHDRDAPKALARAVTFLNKHYGPTRTHVR